MKNVLLLALLVLAACQMFVSCKRTYQCTCPAFTAGAWPYVFEVEASSSRSARNKCIEAGKSGPAVDARDAELCRVYAPPK